MSINSVRHPRHYEMSSIVADLTSASPAAAPASARATAPAGPSDRYTAARAPDRNAFGGATRFERSKPHVNVGGSGGPAPGGAVSASCTPSPARVAADPQAAGYAQGLEAVSRAVSTFLTPMAGQELADLAGGVAAVLALKPPALPEIERVFDGTGNLRLDALHLFGQNDLDATTRFDLDRGSANASVAALVLRGKGSLLWGLDGVRADLQAQIATLRASAEAHARDPDFWTRNTGELKAESAARLEHRLKALEGIADSVRNNTVTVRDLNRLADTLCTVYQHTHSGLEVARVNQILDLVPSSAKNTTDIKHPSGVGKIEFSLERWNRGDRIGGVDRDSREVHEAQAQLAKEVIRKIPDGQSAMVGMYRSEPGSLSMGQLPDHFLNVGKTQCGELYVYDSGKTPHYQTGEAAVEHLRSQIGFLIQNRQSTAHKETYDLIPAVAFLLQSKGTID